MLLINYDIVDGCSYNRQRNIEKTFKDQKEFNEYEKRLNDWMYEIQINRIEVVKNEK